MLSLSECLGNIITILHITVGTALLFVFKNRQLSVSVHDEISFKVSFEQFTSMTVTLLSDASDSGFVN